MTAVEPCAHETVEASVDFTRLTAVEDGPVIAYQSSIRVTCKSCREPFQWIGMPIGLSPRMPMVDVDGTELRAPLRPISAPPGFGEAGPGFAVRIPADESSECICCQDPKPPPGPGHAQGCPARRPA